MTYYEQRLPCSGARSVAAKVFYWLGIVHFTTGLILIIVAACIYWTWLLLPLLWFCMGFVYGSIANAMMIDYRYTYDHGRLLVYRKHRCGKEKSVIDWPTDSLQWTIDVPCKAMTTGRINAVACMGEQKVGLTLDTYLLALLKGEIR